MLLDQGDQLDVTTFIQDGKHLFLFLYRRDLRIEDNTAWQRHWTFNFPVLSHFYF